MNFRMLMEIKTILELYFLFIFIFCTVGMKENQGLKEANKGLGWLVSLIDMYFPCNAILVKYCRLFKCCLFYGVHESALAKNSDIRY